MRSKTSEWFTCKVRYEKMMEDGLVKKVTEAYVVEALSFTEAEASIAKGMVPYIHGEFEVADISRATFKEVMFMGDSGDDNADTRLYKSKLQFITVDEKTGKEKRSNVQYLVEGCSLESARRNIDTVMVGTMIDYVIASVAETGILGVMEHEWHGGSEA